MTLQAESRSFDRNARRAHRQACELVALRVDEPLALKELADAVGMSPFHFQRTFKAIVGLTPKEFHEAERVRTLKAGLKSGRSVTDAIYDAGFGSSEPRLRACRHAARHDAAAIPRRRPRACDFACVRENAARARDDRATDRGLCFIQFGDSEKSLEEALAQEYPRATLAPMPQAQTRAFDAWMRALVAYLEGSAASLELPLDVRGTAFQMRVWRYLQTIPYGEVQSYAEVARVSVSRARCARSPRRARATRSRSRFRVIV